jgi:hypothetical protein
VLFHVAVFLSQLNYPNILSISESWCFGDMSDEIKRISGTIEITMRASKRILNCEDKNWIAK